MSGLGVSRASISVLRGCDEILDALIRLGDCLHDQSVNSRETLEALALKYAERGNVVIASLGGRPAGLCAYYDNDIAGGTAFVSMLVVDGSARRRGLGSALLGEVFRRCTEVGMRCVALEVASDNERAIQLYRRMGFSPACEEGDVLVYERTLG